MAKRQQTTGMPTKSRQNQAQSSDTVDNPGLLDRLLGNPQTRAEREAALNQLLIRVTIGSTVIIVLLIAIGLAYTYIYIPAQPVAAVNGEAITVREFQDRVRFEQVRVTQLYLNRIEQLRAFGIGDDQLQQFIGSDPQLSAWNSELQFPDSLASRVLDDIIDDRLIAQEAEAQNITVNDAAIDETINEFFGYDPTQVALIGAEPTETTVPTETPTPFVSPTPTLVPTNTPTPTPEPEATGEATAEVTPDVTAEPDFPTPAPSPTLDGEQVQATYEANVDGFRDLIRQQAVVGDGVTDTFFRNEALRAAVSDSLLPEGEMVPYVNVRHIKVATEEEAFEVLDALENGELFGTLAQAVSTDEATSARGGENDWRPAESFVDAYRDALAEAEIGDLVGPVQTDDGYYIIQVRAREDREVEEFELEGLRAERFTTWLDDLREENSDSIEKFNWIDYLPE